MGKFDGVLLASDFDNTILNTERPRRTGCPHSAHFTAECGSPPLFHGQRRPALP